VKVIAQQVDRLHLLFGNLLTFWVEVAINLTADLEPGLRRRGAMSWMITAWLTNGLPRQFWVMKANSRARSCSICCYRAADGSPLSTDSLIGEALQFSFPEFDPCTVATATVRGDRQTGDVRIARLAKLLPPAPDASTAKAAVSASMPTLTQP